MYAPRHQVGGHQHPHLASLEIVERLLSNRLFLLPMQGGNRDPRPGQLPGHAVGIVPRTDEHQHLRPGLLLEQADQRRHLAALVDQMEPLLDLVDQAVEGIGLDAGRRCQQAIGKVIQLGRQCGGEEQGLTLGGHLIHQPLDIGPETHLQQAIRLIQHQLLQAIQPQHLLSEQIPQSPRRRHQQLRPQRQFGLLSLLCHATAQGEDPQSQSVSHPLQRSAHLHRQLAGRHHYQSLHQAGGGIHPLHQRQPERQCLAAAGLSQRQQILPRQYHGYCKLLDASRRVQGGRQGSQQGGIEVEFAKGHGGTRIKKWEAKSS